MNSPSSSVTCAAVVWLLTLFGHPLFAEETKFAVEERQHLATLASDPKNREARLGLARIQLWTARYREADRAFQSLLRDAPADRDALLGWAQAAYWSGDFRAAERRFERLLAVDPSSTDARKALADLRIVRAPRYEVSGVVSDDSQPMTRLASTARVTYFSDALTRWDARVSTGRLEDEATNASLSLRAFGAGVTTTIPRLRLTVAASAERVAFGDGTGETLANGSLVWRAPRGEVALAADQYPLLGTVSAVQQREMATRYQLTYRHEPLRGWQGAANVHRVSYSDENRGSGADIYFLMPLTAASESSPTIRAGVSAAWRDTEEDRFRFTSFRSEARGDRFAYRFTGVYDPYWTPLDLKEARVIGVVETSISRAAVKLQADGGIARERARSFGPRNGPTAIPQFTFPILIERTHHPWRASVEVTVPIAGRAELRVRYRHETAAFYDLNEFQASVGGRL